MTDRASKILLTLIAIALWGLLLRPFIALPPAQAQTANQSPASASQTTMIAYDGKPIVLVRRNEISVWMVETTANGLKLRRHDEKDLFPMP